MVTQIRQWIAFRELLALSRRPDFSEVEPEVVIRLLLAFARSRVLNAQFQRQGNQDNSAHAARCREALLAIWENSRKRYVFDSLKRARWHLVMASCNSLYEQFRKHYDGDRVMDTPQRKAA